jgi:hypothetical protein
MHHAVRFGTATGAPAAAPERRETEVPRHPSAALGGGEHSQRHPHDPPTRPLAAAVTTAPSPRPRPPDVATERSRSGSRPDGCPLCHHRRRRPRRSSAPMNDPRDACVRTTAEAATRALTPRECARANRTPPPVLLGTSSRQPISSDPPNRPRRRRRQLDQLHGSALHRRSRTTPVRRADLRVGANPDGWSREPNSKNSTCAPSEPKPQRETRNPMPNIPRDGVATAWHMSSMKTSGLEVDRTGEPARRPARPNMRRSHRPCSSQIRSDVTATRARKVRRRPEGLRSLRPSRKRTNTTHRSSETARCCCRETRAIPRQTHPSAEASRLARSGAATPLGVATEGRAPSDDIAARNERALNR